MEYPKPQLLLIAVNFITASCLCGGALSGEKEIIESYFGDADAQLSLPDPKPTAVLPQKSAAGVKPASSAGIFKQPSAEEPSEDAFDMIIKENSYSPEEFQYRAGRHGIQPAAGVKQNLNEAALSEKIVSGAMAYFGMPYVMGGNGNTGIDCSMLVIRALESAGFDAGNFPRSAGGQYNAAKKGHSLYVNGKEYRLKFLPKKAAPQRGDIVFFYRGKSVGHVGIYTGPESGGCTDVVHAAGKRYGVLGTCMPNGMIAGYGRIEIANNQPQPI